MKTLPKWLNLLLLIILLINLSMRYFYSRDIEVQLHDTYVVFELSDAVFVLSLLGMAVLALYLFVEVAGNKYKILALIIAIVNPVAALFVLLLIYAGVGTLSALKDVAPATNPAGEVILVAALGGIFFLHVIIEVNALRKLRTLV